MNVIIFDTETNGLPANYQKPDTDISNWPLPVSLAWVVYQDGLWIKADYRVLKQSITEDTFSAEAFATHGISLDTILTSGQNPETVYADFLKDLKNADCLVGHNIVGFDLKVLGADLLRNELYSQYQTVLPLNILDTMKIGTDVCKLPGKYPGQYKWPKLEELYQAVIGKRFANAHHALVDVMATAKIFWKLVELKFITLP